MREPRDAEPRFSVLLDPGTPQMQTVWFLMARSGFLPARLVQGIPPRFAGGAYGVREVDLDSAAFPEVTLRRPPERPTHVLFHPGDWNTMIGDDPVFRGVLERAGRAAAYGISVLLSGETGTGKGLLARYIHDRSARAAHPFAAVNCATVAPTLAESELFGHRKGASPERTATGSVPSAPPSTAPCSSTRWASTCGSSLPPTRTSSARSMRSDSAGTSTSGSTSSR